MQLLQCPTSTSPTPQAKKMPQKGMRISAQQGREGTLHTESSTSPRCPRGPCRVHENHADISPRQVVGHRRRAPIQPEMARTDVFTPVNYFFQPTLSKVELRRVFCKVSPVQPEARTGVHLSMKSDCCNELYRMHPEKKRMLERIGLPQQIGTNPTRTKRTSVLLSKKSLKMTENIGVLLHKSTKPQQLARPQQLHELVEYLVLLLSFASHQRRRQRALPLGAGRRVRQSAAVDLLASPRLAG